MLCRNRSRISIVNRWQQQAWAQTWFFWPKDDKTFLDLLNARKKQLDTSFATASVITWAWTSYRSTPKPCFVCTISSLLSSFLGISHAFIYWRQADPERFHPEPLWSWGGICSHCMGQPGQRAPQKSPASVIWFSGNTRFNDPSQIALEACTKHSIYTSSKFCDSLAVWCQYLQVDCKRI